MRIAITGGIAEGKSTVLACLADLGLSVVNSDQIARLVFERAEIQVQLAEVLGLPDGPVDRLQMRRILAEDPEVRRKVNRIMHPPIRAEMEHSEAVFHEVPLLLEVCLYGRYDEVWGVTCGPEEQRKRLFARIKNENVVDSLLASQLPTTMKLAFADEVLDTRKARSEVENQVRKLVLRRFPRLR